MMEGNLMKKLKLNNTKTKKHKLISDAHDEMEDNTMFHFENDDPDRMMQGCLTKRTLRERNASKYVQIIITKEGKGFRHRVIDEKGKEHFNQLDKENFVHINVRKILEDHIHGKKAKKEL